MLDKLRISDLVAAKYFSNTGVSKFFGGSKNGFYALFSSHIVLLTHCVPQRFTTVDEGVVASDDDKFDKT